MKYIYVVIILILAGCYGPKKATRDFSRAVAFDPAMLAQSCARKYPPMDTTVRDTVVVTDTTVLPGESTTDTVIVNDTVRITRTIQLPGSVVTRTVTIRDTIRVTNTASVEACRLEVAKLQSQKDVYVAEVLKTHRGRDKWRTIALVSLGVNALLAFFKIRSMFTPKLRSV